MRIRIRVHKTKMNADPCGSGSTTLEKSMGLSQYTQYYLFFPAPGEATSNSPEGTSYDPTHKNTTFLNHFLFGGNFGFLWSGTTDPFASGTVTHKTATKDRKLFKWYIRSSQTRTGQGFTFLYLKYGDWGQQTLLPITEKKIMRGLPRKLAWRRACQLEWREWRPLPWPPPYRPAPHRNHERPGPTRTQKTFNVYSFGIL